MARVLWFFPFMPKQNLAKRKLTKFIADELWQNLTVELSLRIYRRFD